jgi:hypothetical protein
MVGAHIVFVRFLMTPLTAIYVYANSVPKLWMMHPG